jgi:hypothetical protein
VERLQQKVERQREPEAGLELEHDPGYSQPDYSDAAWQDPGEYEANLTDKQRWDGYTDDELLADIGRLAAERQASGQALRYDSYETEIRNEAERRGLDLPASNEQAAVTNDRPTSQVILIRADSTRPARMIELRDGRAQIGNLVGGSPEQTTYDRDATMWGCG